MKKIGEALSFFGGGDKEFYEIFRRSRKEEYDFTYLSVQELEARRNHDDLIWSKKDGWAKPWKGEILDSEEEEEDNETNETSDNISKANKKEQPIPNGENQKK